MKTKMKSEWNSDYNCAAIMLDRTRTNKKEKRCASTYLLRFAGLVRETPWRKLHAEAFREMF